MAQNKSNAFELKCLPPLPGSEVCFNVQSSCYRAETNKASMMKQRYLLCVSDFEHCHFGAFSNLTVHQSLLLPFKYVILIPKRSKYCFY